MLLHSKVSFGWIDIVNFISSFIFSAIYILFKIILSIPSIWKYSPMWKGNPPTLLVGMKVGEATVENSMEVPGKTKNRITIWLSNPTPGHISRQSYNSKRYIYPYVHSSTIHKSQDIETTWMSIDSRVDKEDVACI